MYIAETEGIKSKELAGFEMSGMRRVVVMV